MCDSERRQGWSDLRFRAGIKLNPHDEYVVWGTRCRLREGIIFLSFVCR